MARFGAWMKDRGRARRGSPHVARALLVLALGMAASGCRPQSPWDPPVPECTGTGDTAREDAAREHGQDPRAYVEEDGLPVLHLYVADSLPDDDAYQAARVFYRGRCYVARARHRGATSKVFPKRSFTLDFLGGQTFDEPLLAAGFTGRRKVVLISPFNDNSYLRARLGFTLWSRMSPDHLKVKTFSAVVYLNGLYHGLYTVADHVDRHSLSAQGMDVQGELFKAVDSDANFSWRDASGRPKASLRLGYEKKEGEPEQGDGAYASIEQLTAFVADSPAERFRTERGAWMQVEDYEDWWIFAHLAALSDSVTKNAYHFRAQGPARRWRYIPWDLDASFGQNWDTTRQAPDLMDSFTEENRLFARMLEDPTIRQPLRERLHTLIHTTLHRDVVQGLIDTYAAEVDRAARKDEAHWGEAYRHFPRWNQRTDILGFEEEVQYLHDWVDAHWALLEEEFR
ncbi:CotH kinase family protein [Corallococcus sp. AB011P]|uniref:CotH kinase family protein n=1 Tax=Corallococcus sp. AB011P TaxID=2316735 RepID=UPI0013154AA4|nr:CotH kinase family protein [Corallococcus sp. AB011P]